MKHLFNFLRINLFEVLAYPVILVCMGLLFLFFRGLFYYWLSISFDGFYLISVLSFVLVVVFLSVRKGFIFNFKF